MAIFVLTRDVKLQPTNLLIMVMDITEIGWPCREWIDSVDRLV